MQAPGLKKVLLAMLGGVQALVWSGAAAAPPGVSQPTPQAHPTVAQNISQNLTSLSAHLDLRLPTRLPLGEEKPDAFPSALIHRQFGATEQTTQMPTSSASNARIRPPIEEMARHIQHEGLPIARLWENQSALVHLGLNPHGKPGLWLVQKVH